MTYGRWFLTASLLLALVLGGAPQVSAALLLTLDIDDSTEGPPTITLTNSLSGTTTQVGPFPVPENTGNFQISAFIGQVVSIIPAVFLLDSDGLVSDTLVVRAASGDNNAQISFFSDFEPLVRGTCATTVSTSCIPEDGTFQTLVTIPLVAGSLVVRVRSDVDPTGVPEPGTFLLLGSGFAGLLAARRWRHRRE